MPATLIPAPENPLDQSHHRELAAAAERARPIRRAAGVASFNAWSSAILAALSAPFALFSTVGFLAFAALAAVAWNEFRGRRRLLAFDPAAVSILGWNQLGLLAMIAVYCAWSLYTNLAGSNSLEAQLAANPELNSALGSLDGMEGFDGLYRLFVVAVFGSVMVLSVIFQGGNAIYYFTRRRFVEDYIRATPAWVIDLQRSTRNA